MTGSPVAYQNKRTNEHVCRRCAELAWRGLYAEEFDQDPWTPLYSKGTEQRCGRCGKTSEEEE